MYVTHADKPLELGVRFGSIEVLDCYYSAASNKYVITYRIKKD